MMERRLRAVSRLAQGHADCQCQRWVWARLLESRDHTCTFNRDKYHQFFNSVFIYVQICCLVYFYLKSHLLLLIVFINNLILI